MTYDKPLNYESFEPSWSVGPIFPPVMGVMWVLFVLIDMGAFLVFTTTHSLTDSLPIAILPLITVCTTYLLHEGVLALVGQWYGCEVSFGIDVERWSATPYVVTAGRKTRTQQFVISLAPLILLDGIAMIVIALSSLLSVPWLLGVIVFATNTFGSIQGIDSDIATVYRLWQLPPTVQIRDQMGEPRQYLRLQTDG
ncbi:hypothetical protein A4G99_23430 [Haladaptatus sp. R4]|uniref:DUF3267 domain-containing protein n=1 Tax=Haladaptatus sp. R4 TaxID=1679489 RepID=UPI0007B45E3D|nr:DUF3267 domain-containing protein [Haladaptatus sp. R4]KZN26033.1 hypothetical protein A4G99_23430 [Haladaptatus sp. R4]